MGTVIQKIEYSGKNSYAPMPGGYVALKYTGYIQAGTDFACQILAVQGVVSENGVPVSYVVSDVYNSAESSYNIPADSVNIVWLDPETYKLVVFDNRRSVYGASFLRQFGINYS